MQIRGTEHHLFSEVQYDSKRISFSGNTFSRYVFNLSKYLEQASVKEILSCLYSGENFEGYDRVHLPYHRLADIFNGRILPTYYEALKKITGVYCLTDTHTGKLYITRFRARM